MVSIEHTAAYVSDLEATRAFYESYFGAVANDGYHNPRTGLRTYFLTFGAGSRLEIMTRPGHDEPRPAGARGWAHVAFALGSEEEVDALAERLRADGVPVVDGPRTTGDGYYEAVLLDPDGNTVEIVA